MAGVNACGDKGAACGAAGVAGFCKRQSVSGAGFKNAFCAVSCKREIVIGVARIAARAIRAL